MIHTNLPYFLCMVLFVIGIYSIVAKKNLIKIVVGLLIIEYAVNLFLVLLCYRTLGLPPILTQKMSVQDFVRHAVDPLPQALILTSIVIGLGVLALTVALVIRLYDKYGTFDITEIKSLKG